MIKTDSSVEFQTVCLGKSLFIYSFFFPFSLCSFSSYFSIFLNFFLSDFILFILISRYDIFRQSACLLLIFILSCWQPFHPPACDFVFLFYFQVPMGGRGKYTFGAFCLPVVLTGETIMGYAWGFKDWHDFLFEQT